MSDILDHQQQKSFPIKKIWKYYFIAAFISFVAIYIAMIFDDRKLIEKYWNQHSQGYVVGWLLWDIIFIIIGSFWYWLLVGFIYLIHLIKIRKSPS
jgi:hypothetical protein